MATRFWVGGTGTWDASTTTHWAALSGAAGGQTVPTNADTVTFDGASGGGTVTVNTTVDVVSITMGAFTGTIDFSVNNNTVTLQTFSGTGTGVRTLNMGSGTWSITSNVTGTTIWNMTTVTSFTFNANTSVIDITGAMAAATTQTFAGGGKTYSTVRVSGSRLNSALTISGANTIGTLSITAPAYLVPANGHTFTNFTTSAQFTLSLASGGTWTFTNAPTLAGTATAPIGFIGNGAGTTSNLSCASGTFSLSYAVLECIKGQSGATFTATNSFDLGNNVSITITAPSAATASMLVHPGLAGGARG